ncbi:MAG: efflux RND transporter periplasmic adaptor subunit, partial [Gemmataceae bacterium]|nr:efflux RND transporter periplasmic adaptor subunit [Gemmataceae bacterium]
AGPRPEERAEAKAAADAARARAAQMHAGARDEEKNRVRHELDAAAADERQADDDLARHRQVYGASAGGAMDYQNALTHRDRARSRTRAARAAFDLAMNGYRPEEVAEADAEAAKFEARHELLRKGTRDEDKAAAAAAEAGAAAELAEAEAQLAEAVVVAPERCLVEVVPVRPGDLVPAGQPVVRALRADDLWVKAFVPATDLGRVRVGQPAAVTTDSYPGRRFAGEVTHVAAASEFTPRNVQSVDERRHQVFAVRVRVADPGGVFKSGMAAEVFLAPAEE